MMLCEPLSNLLWIMPEPYVPQPRGWRALGTRLRSGVIFHAYASAHNKLESVAPTFSSLESMMAPSKEGEHGRKRDNSGRKKAPR